jgi:diguanylate cyclase (GGDEF)-like protein/PAS domain S-box-containing protein
MSNTAAADALSQAGRLTALGRTGLMWTGPEPEFDDLLDLLRHALGVEAATLNLLDDKTQFCKGASDTRNRLQHGDTVPVGETLCEHAIRAGQPLAIDDLQQLAWARVLPTVTVGGAAAYLGVPLHSPDGQVIGVLCAVSREFRHWTPADVVVVEKAARAVAAEIRLRSELRARVASERALREREARLRLIFEGSALGIAVLDDVGRFEEANPALSRILGASAAELSQRTLLTVAVPEDYRRERRDLVDLLRGRRTRVQCEMRFVRTGGEQVWVRLTASRIGDAAAGHVRVLTLWEDVTERRAAESELRQLSLTDDLTGLSNRRGFLHRAGQKWEHAALRSNEIAILYMDLDDFKHVNDTHGHAAGDMALRSLANVLRQCYRDDDLLARLGGDEFVVLAAMSADQAARLAVRLHAAVQRFNDGGTLPFPLELSIGIVRADPVTETLPKALSRADHQMYEVKRTRKRDRAPRAVA